MKNNHLKGVIFKKLKSRIDVRIGNIEASNNLTKKYVPSVHLALWWLEV